MEITKPFSGNDVKAIERAAKYGKPHVVDHRPLGEGIKIIGYSTTPREHRHGVTRIITVLSKEEAQLIYNELHKILNP